MKTIKNKNIINILLILGAFAFLIPTSIMSTDKPYFSGEVISYNNKIIFGTVNSDNFELFTLEGDKIGRQAMISSDE